MLFLILLSTSFGVWATMLIDDVVAKLDGLFVGIDDRITLTPLQTVGQHSLDQVTLGS
jgi:hypothetical protein